MENREKEDFETLVHSGKIYDCSNPKIMLKQQWYKRLIHRYNKLSPLRMVTAQRLLKRIFAECGKDCWIETPFHANFGGRHVKLGDNVYANSNLTLVDDTWIEIGDKTMLGPNVTICTAAHPFNPELRDKAMQYNLPVKIGKSVWVGAGVSVMPGVNIGDGSVIGAGSIVTRDIPAGVLAYGVPCRVIKLLSECPEKAELSNK